MTASKRLGKGIKALYNEIAETKNLNVNEVEISKIRPNPEQVRKDFDSEGIKELAESIKAHGLLEPILITPDGADKYMIVAGERRYRAFIEAGKDKIPAIIKEFPKEDIKKLSLIENIQRQNLNPVEEALSYKELMEEAGLTQAELASEIGKSRSHVANSLRLLNLQADVLQSVREGKISFGHGKILSSLPMDEQKKLAKKITDFGLSVRDTERAKKNVSTKKRDIVRSPYAEEMEAVLSSALMTRVRIVDGDIGGKLVVDFYSQEELDRLIEFILER